MIQVIDAEGIEGGSGSNDRKRHLQQNFHYLLSEITSTKLYVKNLIVYRCLCQKAPGRKFKKVKVPYRDFFCSTTYEMYEQAKSKVNIFPKLECLKKCSREMSSLNLSYKCIQYIQVSAEVKNTSTRNRNVISKIYILFPILIDM